MSFMELQFVLRDLLLGEVSYLLTFFKDILLSTDYFWKPMTCSRLLCSQTLILCETGCVTPWVSVRWLKGKSLDSVPPDGLGRGNGSGWLEKGVPLMERENPSHTPISALSQPLVKLSHSVVSNSFRPHGL